jgi:large subunit ribosomal protein L10
LAISKERKQELVAEYTDMLQRSQGVVLTEFRGLTDGQFKNVRRLVREANGTYRVAKTTLLKRALEASGYPIPDLAGAPLGIGFCFDNVPGVAKVLTDYAKDQEGMVIRGGLMSGQILSETELKTIANLPSMDVLRAQLVGLLDAPAASLVGVIQAGVGQVVNVIDAYARKGEGAAA